MALNKNKELHFDKFLEERKLEIEAFWSRMPGNPKFEGKKILDFGSGLGSLCFDLVSKGAFEVIGLDKDNDSINYSNKLIKKYFEGGNLKFTSDHLTKLPNNYFDMIVSKDTFEHVKNLPVVMKELVKKLKVGGEMYLGYGPLWNSPFGDHGLAKYSIPIKLPWLHLLLGEIKIIENFNLFIDKNSNEIVPRHLDYLESYLNKMSLREHKKILANSGLEIVNFKINQWANWNKVSLGFLPDSLMEYWARTIYCYLKKVI